MEFFSTLGGRFFRISKNQTDQFSQWPFYRGRVVLAGRSRTAGDVRWNDPIATSESRRSHVACRQTSADRL